MVTTSPRTLLVTIWTKLEAISYKISLTMCLSLTLCLRLSLSLTMILSLSLCLSLSLIILDVKKVTRVLCMCVCLSLHRARGWAHLLVIDQWLHAHLG